MRAFSALLADRRGASAAEFAMVLPVFLLIVFGTIDAGRYAWQLNQLEKAAQAGVRYAVVTDIVPEGLNSYDTTGIACPDGVLDVSDRICAEALGEISCSGAGGLSCSCTRGPCPPVGTANGTAFGNIVARMASFKAGIGPENVAISYEGSGLGFAGDPTVTDGGDPLSDISPLVTVEISDVGFRPFILFGARTSLPSVSSSLTLEDGEGAVGY